MSTMTKILQKSLDYCIGETDRGTVRIMLIGCAGFETAGDSPELRAIAALPPAEFDAAAEAFFDAHVYA